MDPFYTATNAEELQRALAAHEQTPRIDLLSVWSQRERWTMLRLPVSLRHPRARTEVDRIPVPPVQPPEAGVDGGPRPSRVDSALLELGYEELRVRCGETSDPASLQQAFERWVALANGEPIDNRPTVEPPPDDEDWAYEGGDPVAPQWCRWTDRGLTVVFADGHAMRLTDGSWVHRARRPSTTWRVWEALERTLMVDTAGRLRRLVEVGDYPIFMEPTPDGRFVWVEDKHGGGGVFDVSNGQLAACPRSRGDGGLRLLAADGSVQTFDEEDYDAMDRAEAALATAADAFAERFGGWWVPPSAIVQRADGTFRTLREGVLDGELTLSWPVCCAAFSPQGDELALVDLERVVVVGDEVRSIPLP